MDAGFYNKYPYTDFHELNLDWIISNMKKLLDEYQSLVDWMENDAANYNDFLNRLITLESRATYLQNEIDAERIRVDTLFGQVYNEFTNQYTRITSEYESLYSNILTEMNSSLAAMTVTIDQYKAELITMINDGDDAIMGWVNARLQAFINSLPDYENLIIYNPVQGRQTNVQTAINDLYGYFSIFALTANEYDNLGLTADEYDDYRITAQEYDTMGSQLLGINSRYLMRDPFTGIITPIADVVLKLFDLHRTGALTASAYDALDMTATYYDGLDLAAYDYDTLGI